MVINFDFFYLVLMSESLSLSQGKSLFGLAALQTQILVRVHIFSASVPVLLILAVWVRFIGRLVRVGLVLILIIILLVLLVIIIVLLLIVVLVHAWIRLWHLLIIIGLWLTVWIARLLVIRVLIHLLRIGILIHVLILLGAIGL